MTAQRKGTFLEGELLMSISIDKAAHDAWGREYARYLNECFGQTDSRSVDWSSAYSAARQHADEAVPEVAAERAAKELETWRAGG